MLADQLYVLRCLLPIVPLLKASECYVFSGSRAKKLLVLDGLRPGTIFKFTPASRHTHDRFSSILTTMVRKVRTEPLDLEEIGLRLPQDNQSWNDKRCGDQSST